MNYNLKASSMVYGLWSMVKNEKGHEGHKEDTKDTKFARFFNPKVLHSHEP